MAITIKTGHTCSRITEPALIAQAGTITAHAAIRIRTQGSRAIRSLAMADTSKSLIAMGIAVPIARVSGGINSFLIDDRLTPVVCFFEYENEFG